MLEDVGPMQLGIVLVIVVMIFGAGKLPQTAASLGKAMREFKKESARADDDNDVDEAIPKRKRIRAKRTPTASNTAEATTVAEKSVVIDTSGEPAATTFEKPSVEQKDELEEIGKAA